MNLNFHVLKCGNLATFQVLKSHSWLVGGQLVQNIPTMAERSMATWGPGHPLGGHSLCPVGMEWSLAPPTRGWKHVGGTTQKYPQTWTNTGAQSKIPPVGPLIQILLLTPGENFPERQQEPHPLVCSPWRRSGTPPRTHGFPPGMVGREEEMDDPRKCG